jgi:hypothetical protein
MTGHGRGVLCDAVTKAEKDCASSKNWVERARAELRQAEDAHAFWITERDGLKDSLRILQEAWEATE